MTSDIDDMKQEGIIPDWIKTTTDAQHFIYLEYSTNDMDKQWKESEAQFLDRFSITYMGFI